jgi:general secretion pathway protein F
MPAFHYHAIDPQGSNKKGTIEADSERQARQSLRDMHLMPISLQKAASKSATLSQRFLGRTKIPIKELTLITRQLATLLSAGLPIEEVLAAVAEQTEKQRTKGLLLAVRSKVVEGHALATALKEHPYAFSDLYCATVAAGEKSGHLELVLQRLADYIEQQLEIRQKILQALIYPIVMVIVAASILGFLLEVVVPKMISVYSNTGQVLPLMTQCLITLSAFTKDYGLLLFLSLCISIGIFRYYQKKSPRLREKTHRFILRVPILGHATKVINTARFSQTFAILSTAGVPILEAMTIASALITNVPMKTAINNATSHVREGAAIHRALKQTQYFSPMSIHLIASGEGSGQLEPMLERVAKNQLRDITRLIDTSLALFEPAIILVMGSMVLFIVLAVLLPIFQLDQFTG